MLAQFATKVLPNRGSRTGTSRKFTVFFQDWKGLKITVRLTTQNHQAKVNVVPSAATLTIKAIKEPPRDRKRVKNTIENFKIIHL